MKMKKKSHLILLFFLTVSLQAQIVSIPDSKLKNALINSLCVDTTGDGLYDSDVDTNDDNEIQISEAKAVNRLDISKKEIKSLQGIEAFSELKILNCSQNKLTNIDLSKNIRLVNLFINDNQLSDIDVSNNLELVIFNCWGNQLTSLDVSSNKSLSILYCSSNKLESLDVSQNHNLIALFCFLNNLKSLNLKNNQNNKLGSVMTNFNPDLKCIQVDNQQASIENPNWLKDATSIYQENCSTLSIDNFTTNNLLIFYPNPVKESLTIKTSNISDLDQIEIFDMYGNLVLRKKIMTNTLDLTKLSSGTYFLKTKVSKKIIIKKIIKL
jgi:hypothetical protein